MKRLKKRVSALLLTLCLLIGLSLPTVWADPAEITISSVKELESFAKSCALDTWSQGKTVRLTADLNLEGREFTPIPTFGGVFLGDGHKIEGLRITAAGSNMGLFRYLQEGAVVQGLNVAGTVRPAGSAADVGGIAGNNAGAIRNCTFHGIVEGKSAVGGIAGLNRESGEIARAAVSGTVTGQEFTGGAAGRNLGALLQCENGASVNTNTPDADAGVDMDALTLPLEGAAAPAEEDDGGFLKSHSDTGGIVGWSTGIVYSCLNTGAVGYPHVGYNVGGVAGRQSGHLSGCANRGEIFGRKDVGGIVGQAEPDVALSADGGTLDRLRRELDTLESLIDRTLDRAEGNGNGISDRLSAIGSTTGAARDHTEDLLNRLSDFADGNLGSINTLSATVTKALDDLTPALDELSDASGRLEILADRLDGALNALGGAAEGGADVSADASLAAGIFRRAGAVLSAAVEDFGGAVEALKRAVVIQDQEAVDKALADLSGAIESFSSAMAQAREAADALLGALESLPDLEGVRDVLRNQLSPALKDMSAALHAAGAALTGIGKNTGLDWTQIASSLREAGLGFQGLGSASRRLNEAVGALQTALSGLGSLSGQLGSAIRELGDAASLAAPVGRGLERAFDILKTVTENLAEDGPTQFAPLGEDTRNASRDLFDTLSDLSSQLEDLHTAVSDTAGQLSGDLRAVSRQFSKVFEALLDTLDEAGIGEDASRDILEDTSDENIAATRLGKVENCRNEGPVDGDRNVGGILGAMSIEYGLDPENDLEFSLGGTYETKAVLQGGVNHGAVTSKKDCAGGLVGRMDLGTVLNGENYGPVASASGSFVGGVAGYADGVVRESFAKCTLSGADDIGGIAGWADRIRNCWAIATVLEGAERLGAIAGSGELDGIWGSCFIDTGLAGIDGVSYAGIAEPRTFEELRALPDIPAEFAAFTLTLRTENEVVKEIPFTYGQDLSRIELPPVPEREGFYGKWPDFDTSGLNSDITLDAVYQPWVTLVASQERQGQLPLALAEGQFTDEAVLKIQPAPLSPDGAARAEAESAKWWEVSLTGAGLGPEDTVALRLLNHTGGKAEVWEFRDGWRDLKRVDAEVNGSYLIIPMTNVHDGSAYGTFKVAPARNTWLSTILLAAGALLILAALRQVKKRKKKKAPAKP